jgi:transcriptional regulator GlxA family with amidase domain
MDRRIEILIAKMENDSTARWNVAKLAAQVNLSASRLRHLFKEETGTTPANYLKDLRLRRAEELLSTTFLSVKEIVKRVGLGSESHFVREFKRIRGTSPTKYRRATMTQRQRVVLEKRIATFIKH